MCRPRPAPAQWPVRPSACDPPLARWRVAPRPTSARQRAQARVRELAGLVGKIGAPRDAALPSAAPSSRAPSSGQPDSAATPARPSSELATSNVMPRIPGSVEAVHVERCRLVGSPRCNSWRRPARPAHRSAPSGLADVQVLRNTASPPQPRRVPPRRLVELLLGQGDVPEHEERDAVNRNRIRLTVDEFAQQTSGSSSNSSARPKSPRRYDTNPATAKAPPTSNGSPSSRASASSSSANSAARA